MAAKDDYPELAAMTERGRHIARDDARNALNEIDYLRAVIAERFPETGPDQGAG